MADIKTTVNDIYQKYISDFAKSLPATTKIKVSAESFKLSQQFLKFSYEVIQAGDAAEAAGEISEQEFAQILESYGININGGGDN